MRRICLLGLAALVAMLGTGFAWFTVQARRPGEAPGPADGIVVLTGGAGRIELGLRLLADRRADRLLISGTGRGELSDILAGAGIDARLAAEMAPGAVTLGREARSTRGNAREAADWAAAHGMGSLIVVTSGYHMPRALIELRRTLPAAVALYPAPLVPRLADGHDEVPLRLLAAEYGKWLAALAGLSARDDEAPGAPRRGG